MATLLSSLGSSYLNIDHILSNIISNALISNGTELISAFL